jgi:hypothetical protein
LAKRRTAAVRDPDHVIADLCLEFNPFSAETDDCKGCAYFSGFAATVLFDWRTTMTTQNIQTAIKAAPAQAWRALVDPSVTPACYICLSAEVRSYGWVVVALHRWRGEMIMGKVVVANKHPPWRCSFHLIAQY